MSGLLSRLEKKEFIAIRADEADRRCKRVHLLPKGEACHQQIHAVIDLAEESLVQGFTPEERAELLRLLDKAAANICATSHCHKEENTK